MPLNVRTAIALTLEELARRNVEIDRPQAQTILDALLSEPIPGSIVMPQRSITDSLTGENDSATHPTAEDHHWQLHLTVARARLSLGMEWHTTAKAYLHDERNLVRRAFAQLQATAATPVA